MCSFEMEMCFPFGRGEEDRDNYWVNAHLFEKRTNDGSDGAYWMCRSRWGDGPTP